MSERARYKSKARRKHVQAQDIGTLVAGMIRVLELGDETDWAKALDGAYHGSCHPAEIMGDTRDVLRRLRADPVAKALALEDDADLVIDALNLALGGPGST